MVDVKRSMWTVWSGLAAVAVASLPMAQAQDMGKLDERLNAAAGIIQEVMAAPDHAIPETILGSSHCLIVIPSMKKAAFAVGAQYGQGVATCRTSARGWSAPVFVRLGGVSFGFQIGGQATDLVLVGMNNKSAQDMLHSKVKLGADAAASAGPVGRNAQAATDVLLNAEFLTYSRSKGLFAGVDLTGDYLDANDDDNKAEYGADLQTNAVLAGTVPPKPNAARFIQIVKRYFGIAKNWQTQEPPKHPVVK